MNMEQRLDEMESRLHLDVASHAATARRAIIASAVIAVASLGLVGFSLANANHQRAKIEEMLANNHHTNLHNFGLIQSEIATNHASIVSIINCKVMISYKCMGQPNGLPQNLAPGATNAPPLWWGEAHVARPRVTQRRVREERPAPWPSQSGSAVQSQSPEQSRPGAAWRWVLTHASQRSLG